jgi:type II secretion system protein J
VKANQPRRDRLRSSARGFTVIELVIAIAVGAIVVVTIGSVLSRVSQTRDVARTQLDAVSRANAALDALRTDLVSVVRDEDLYNTRVLLLDGTGYSPIGPADRDEVLVYNNRLRPMKRDDYQGEGGEYESQYRLDAVDGVLWMRRDAVPDQNGEGGGMAIPVVDGVVAVSIEAYDGEAWYPDWDSDEMGLPWALRVSVTAVGGDLENPSASRPMVTLRTQIPLDRIVPPPPPPEEEETALGGTDPALGGLGGAASGGADAGLTTGGGMGASPGGAVSGGAAISGGGVSMGGGGGGRGNGGVSVEGNPTISGGGGIGGGGGRGRTPTALGQEGGYVNGPGVNLGSRPARGGRR